MAEISAVRKTTVPLLVTITDSTGTAIDITGYTLFFTVKKNTSQPQNTTDADALISKTLTTFSDPTHGIARITLSSTDTSIPAGSYLYDIGYKDLSGNRYLSEPDDFTIIGNITQRSS
jgi:hypothetical protein